VVGGDDPGAPFALPWDYVPAPPNDDFDDAAELTGTKAEARGTTAGGTPEPGEPRHAGLPGGV
jgi:hypothetical protein